MLKLTPAQEEQIIKMDRDGSKAGEIITFFQSTYQITLNEKKISNVKHKAKMNAEKRAAEFRGEIKKKPGRKPKATAVHQKSLGGGTDINISELVVLLQEVDAGYKKLLQHFKDTLKNLRTELVKSRAEVQEMLKGAGIGD